VLYTNGNIIKEGTSGLSAIQEIINRLEGTPSQKITGPRRRHVELDWMGRWVPICVDELPALAGWRLVAKIKHMVCHLLYNTVQLGARKVPVKVSLSNCRRRHQPSRPPPAKIRPGSPAPAMGPGTPTVGLPKVTSSNTT
jgi:hypothetical protein